MFPDAASSRFVILVGSSTGGTEALRVFLSQMPADVPPILITQHMPEMFVPSFAERLNSTSKVRVKLAEQNERILAGQAYLAPGHSHLQVGPMPLTGYRTVLSQGPPVNHHRPSVEVLFSSAAKVLGRNAIGVMLTGMGKDGAAGMLAMRQAGSYNLAQDEDSSVVFGMPRAAIELGAVDEVVALEKMAERVMARLSISR